MTRQQAKLCDLVAQSFVLERLLERERQSGYDSLDMSRLVASAAYVIARNSGVSDADMRKASTKLGRKAELTPDERRW
jgi:hypothetical protein